MPLMRNTGNVSGSLLNGKNSIDSEVNFREIRRLLERKRDGEKRAFLFLESIPINLCKT